MGYRAGENPIFGNSAVDETIEADATWTGIKEYRDLTIGNGVAARVIQAGRMEYGPLIIRCRGTLRITNNAVLHSDGKGAMHSGAFQGNGGLIGTGPGVSSLAGFSWSNSGISLQPGVGWGLVPIGAGGGGGWGTNGNGWPSYLGWDQDTNYIFDSPLFTDKQVAGGTVGSKAGEDGADHITGGQVRADYIPSVLAHLGVGTGGGCGGRSDEGSLIDGGDSGGSILILAKSVIVDTGGIIRANGNDGLDATGTDQGGAGGGSGGYVGIYTERYINNGTVEVAGGSGGTGNGTGGNGGSGSVGCIKIERAA